MLEKIKKYDEILVFVVLLSILSIATFGANLTVHDELWNFSNVYKMSKGYIIYKECNVIVTPLFFYIGNIIFRLFGANYLVFRIYGLLINVFLYGAVYKLFKVLNTNKTKSLLYMLIILNITQSTLFWGSNYNNLAILIAVIGMILMLKKKNAVLQGVIIFLIFMAKQNIGIYYALAISVYQLWKNRDFKRAFKDSLIEFVTVLALLTIYIIYLHITGNLTYFIDLTFLGMSEFAIKNISIGLNALSNLVLGAIMLAFSFVVIVNQKITIPQEEKNNIKLLWCIALIFIMIAYPIFNVAHIVLAGIFTLICYTYVMECLLLKELVQNKRIINILSLIAIITLTLASIFTLYEDIVSKGNTNFAKPYYGVKVEENMQHNIEKVCEYMLKNQEKGINTIIVSCNADLYMNVLNKNNNKFDLPFMGNLGGAGVEGMIGELNSMKKTHLLV